LIFHSSTKKYGGTAVTNGGRVLSVTALGKNISEATAICKKQLRMISFEGMYYRKDIGYEFM
jgi:phosphoribosylamine--glycine ligase